MLQRTLTTKLSPLVVIICLMLVPVSVPAKELQYPVPCYQGDELAKIQAWEKTWAGKKISSANVDEVKEFLPETFYTIMKEQLGYMVMAVGLKGDTPAMFHLTTHAFFKALLVLGAGSAIHALHHEQDIWKMGGL